MRLPITLLTFLAALAAQPSADPDLKKKAREYLDAASGMIASAPPEFQSGALLELAVVESTQNPPRARELFDQALAAGAILPAQKGYRVREEFQALVAAQIAKIDLDRAVEILRMIAVPPTGEPDYRAAPLREITRQLASQNNIDKAVETLDAFSLGGAYPWEAVAILLKNLPPGDERRHLFYSQALTSFQQRPDVEAYARFLRAQRKDMSPQTFDAGVRALAKSALDDKGMPEPMSQTVTTAGGSVTLSDPKDVELFNIIDLVAGVDPSWAKEIAASRPGLQPILGKYPQGIVSLEKTGDTVTTRGTIRPGESKASIEQRARVLAFETQKAQETMTHLRGDMGKALEAIRQIPTPRLQARMLETVAYAAGAKKPEEGLPLLGQCVEVLDDIKEPDYRPNGWGAIAVNASKLGDRNLAVRVLEKGVTDARAMWKKDSNPDDPNLAPRPVWPSTNIYRTLFYRAARALGADADALLEKIPDAEIQILARVEMAAAWLDTPLPPSLTFLRRKNAP